jgi:hypothetical protein
MKTPVTELGDEDNERFEIVSLKNIITGCVWWWATALREQRGYTPLLWSAPLSKFNPIATRWSWSCREGGKISHESSLRGYGRVNRIHPLLCSHLSVIGNRQLECS